MDSAQWDRVQTIFHSAVSQPPSEQNAFVEAACGDDRECMAEVLAMLKQDSLGASLLDRGLPHVAYRMIGASGQPRELGPYRLKSILGEGGMGVVWLAERADAGNLVAIKFLPHAGLSPARRERFASEIKTLAKLKHPYIARLYDAGALDDGTPWFVMEYVDGVPLTEYCRTFHPSIEGRLRLFRMVCEAVRYAHGQAIIHRDLKPPNILIEKDGTPRLLDFGIARQLQAVDDPSDRTRAGLRFLSPDYAAPEWARDGTVGLYTDVYSLGVILYEMLAGALPDRSSDHADKPSLIARNSSLSQRAWSDLDVLCLKAMRREPHERYPSVEALIRDIDHYQKGEPLEARPDSWRYRAGKFVIRNRSVVAATSVALAVILGLVVFFTLRLTKARNTALAQAARTERIERFMENLFEGGDQDAGPADNLRVITLLDRGVHEADGLNRDPVAQADLYKTLGTIYRKLGKLDRADPLLHTALDRRRSAAASDVSAIADDLREIGMLRVDQARLPEAERLIRQALAMEQRSLPPGHPAIARTTAALGRVLEEQGQYEKAIEVLNQALRLQSTLGAPNAGVADSLTLLSDAHYYLGHYSICESLDRRLLTMRRQMHGSGHPRVAAALIDLGNIQIDLGRYIDAEQHFRQALAIDRSWYGKDHPEAARAETYVAQALSWQGRYDESRALLQQALIETEQAYGRMHPRVALVLSTLGSVDQQQGKLDTAEVDFTRMVEIYRSVYGDQHQFTARALANLATIYHNEKQYARAERIFRDVLQVYTRVLPPGNLNTGIAQIRLGRTLVRENRFQEAEEHTLAGYEILVKQTSPSMGFLKGAREDLVRIYEGLNQPAKASKFRAELAASHP